MILSSVRHQLIFKTATLCLLATLLSSPSLAQNQLTGVNLAGAEFAHGTFWPTAQEITYFTDKGMNVIRIPFLWERMQPSLYGSFNSSQQSGLTTAVERVTATGAVAIIDPHNYARRGGSLIGSAQVPDAAFADFWSRLATLFKDNPRVIFGLMNEPHSMSTEQWVTSANAAIAAIRDTGATQRILVPGNAWTGAHSWTQSWYGTSNSVAMLSIADPDENIVFELHQYFDADYSGTSSTCETDHGSDQLVAVTGWLRNHGFQGFLGEFAGADNADCRASVESALDYMDSNRDVWLGWTWWAAGREWGNYIFTLEPTGGFSVDRPQMSWLLPYIEPVEIFSNGFESGDLEGWSSQIGG